MIDDSPKRMCLSQNEERLWKENADLRARLSRLEAAAKECLEMMREPNWSDCRFISKKGKQAKIFALLHFALTPADDGEE